MSAVMVSADMEETDCLLCGSERCAPALEAADSEDPAGTRYRIVRCEECGLWYTSPRPTESAMGRFYPDDYIPHQVHRRRSTRVRPPGWWSLTASRLFHRCPDRRWLEPHGEMRLLDVGCGRGEFLERMHQQGWHVAGLDVSEPVVRRIREELGLRAVLGTLPHPELVPESFDVVTMWQTLEHLHRPLDVLVHARELLAPGGRLIVSVPNIESLPFRWFGTAWNGLELPRHLTHFAPRTLTEMLRRTGFEVGPVRMVRHPSWLRRAARIASKQGVARPWHRLLDFRTVRGALSWYCLVRGRSECLTVTATLPQ